MKWLREFWVFLGLYQNRWVRWLHLVVVLGVVLQIVSSGGMHFDRATGAVPAAPLAWLSDWVHIVAGLALLPLTGLFIVVALATHGPRHYYPYLWRDLAQARADLQDALHLRLSEPRPGGLAAIVTGLGFGALLVAVISGTAWFFLWRAGSAWTHDAREWHETLVGLVEVYFVGHGLMATLHFLAWLRHPGAAPAPGSGSATNPGG